MEGTCGQNLVPTWTIPTKFWGCWGVSNHPKYRHQINHFWLIFNWLTLTFNRLVNFFPCLIGGTCGQNLVATWTIPTKFWGCRGGVKQSLVTPPKWLFLANTQQLDSYIDCMGQFFSLSHGNDLWAKFGTHMNHPHQVLGVLGGVKQFLVTPPKLLFLGNTQPFDSLILQMGQFFS